MMKEDVMPQQPRYHDPVMSLVEYRLWLRCEAEEIVSRAAEAIPVGDRSLGSRLRERGPVAIGAGAAAGLAIRAVAKGFAGGGFHFPRVFDPMRALRVR